jgi:hypothetical protein
MPKRQEPKSQTPVPGSTAGPQNAANIVNEGLRRFTDNLQRFSDLREKVQNSFEQRNRQRPTD